MTEFDAELYLRLLGEEMVLSRDPNQGGRSSPLDEAAGALIAVDAIKAAQARAVSEQYARAVSLRDARGHQMLRMRRSQGSAPKAKALRFGRVVPVQTTIESAEGSMNIRSVRFGSGGISLSIQFTANVSQRRTRRGVNLTRGAHPMPWGAQALSLSDDQGTTSQLNFGGGWGDGDANGVLTSSEQFSQQTRWLELDGIRFALEAGPVHAEVTVEPLSDGDSPAVRYLWRRLAVSERGPQTDIQPAMDALIAAGVLMPDDPVITALEAVQAQMPSRRGGPGGGSASKGLPEPWRSMLRRAGREDGPTGSIAIGAVTPLIDRHRVGLLSIDSYPAGFQADVEISPGEMGMRFGGIPGDQLVWWCRDNRGNHYLGAWGGWSGSPDSASGQINFWPALDPLAERLEMLPTGPTERGVIGFPLLWTRPTEVSQS